MNRFHTIGRLAVVLSGLVGALAAFCVGAVPVAFARAVSPLGGDPHGRPGLVSRRSASTGANQQPPLPAHAHALATGGMPGWQIALIMAGAALVAAGLAVIIYRTRAARRRVSVSAA
jgi:hypothetical protein